MSNAIFISYRRSDTQGWTGHLADALAHAFGAAPLFYDRESIQPSVDFVDAIEGAVASASVVVAVIGPGWLTTTLPDGRRRLDDSNDFVRRELAAALARGVHVIPVLVGGAAMPSVDDLPAEIAAFARRQALELTDARWNYDFERLAAAIATIGGFARVASGSADDGTRQSAIIVGEGAAFEGVEAGDVAGVKADGTLSGQADRPIIVLRGSTIKNSKFQDIVGVKLEQGRTDGKP